MTLPSLPDHVLAQVQRAVTEPNLGGTPYRIIGELGRGGMGVVYEAADTRLARNVALKVLYSEANLGEARLTARLEHPGIVPVHDAGVLPDGRAWYAMKRVRGQRLDEWLREPRSESSRLLTFLRICEPVSFAHANGVMHRDLKPGNIMIGSFGEVLVLDWGIAQDAAEPAMPAGTPGFMAPEPGSGARVDVYSLGCLLALMAGPRPSRVLRSVVRKCTDADPYRRYSDAGELAADVSRYLDGERVAAHCEALWESGLRIMSRHRALLALVAAYLAMRGLLLFFFSGR